MSLFASSILSSSSSSSRKRSSDTPIATSDTTTATSMDVAADPSSSPSNTTTTNASTKLRVRIKKFHGVARWTWNVGNGSDEEVCGICQSAFEGCPPGVKFPGDESPVVFGTCGHAFHLQCVATWLNSNKQTCPICRADWEYGNSGDQHQQGGSTNAANTANSNTANSNAANGNNASTNGTNTNTSANGNASRRGREGAANQAGATSPPSV